MKQKIVDYLDFVVSFIMIIVALNLMDIFVKLPYAYSPNPNFDSFFNFFTFRFHLDVFMHQVIENRWIVYTLFLFCSALIIRLFTNRWKLFILYPMYAILIYAAFYTFNDGFNDNRFKLMIVTFIDMAIIFSISIGLLVTLIIFFKNCHTAIKKISYITIGILGLFALLIYQFGTPNILLTAKWILLIAILILMAISILWCIINIRNKNIIIPQDIIDSKIEIECDAIDREIARKEKRERNRIINDIAKAVRRKL